MGALYLACPGQQIAVPADRVVPLDIYRSCSSRLAKSGDCLSASDYAGLPNTLWQRSLACADSASAPVVSRRLVSQPDNFWNPSRSAGLPDLSLRLHTLDHRNSADH